MLCIPEWQVEHGARLFLQGASGSGKSTLLNLLSGILSADSGDIEIAGTNLQTLSHAQRDRFRARHIGVVFQQFNLIPYLSVMDNVLLAAHFAQARTGSTEDRARQIFSSLNLPEALLNQPAMNLSIGQQQRVAIVRALINQPDIILVDEPTSALDADNRDAFMRLLLEVVNKQGATLIFVSHDLGLSGYFEQHVSLSVLNKATQKIHVMNQDASARVSL